MTRLELLERVNKLNIEGIPTRTMYWAVTVLYNTVIWSRRADQDGATMFEIIKGVPK